MGFANAVAVIIGALFATDISPNRRLEIDDTNGGELRWYSGESTEVFPASLLMSKSSPSPSASIFTTLQNATMDDPNTEPAAITMVNSSLAAGGGSQIGLSANLIYLTDPDSAVADVDWHDGFWKVEGHHAWTKVTGGVGFQNSWVDFGGASPPAAYRLYPDGDVGLRGVVKSGTATTIFTLPAGLRPPAGVGFMVPISPNGATGRLVINSSGAVTINPLSAGSQVFTELTCRFSTLADA